MRELKFRFWDSKNKQMYENNPSFAVAFDGTVSLLRFEGNKKSTNCDCIEWDGTEYSKSVIPLQYTGLKDKNGKEIYEGDIIKEDEYFNANYLVEWDQDNCRFIGTKIGDRDCNILEFPQLAECGEIIGNIYENKDLLEGE